MTKQPITTTRRNKGTDIVAAFRASGKTRTEFCSEAGIKVATFDYYHHRVRAEERARLVPVEVVADSHIAGSASGRDGSARLIAPMFPIARAFVTNGVEENLNTLQPSRGGIDVPLKSRRFSTVRLVFESGAPAGPMAAKHAQ